MSYLSRFAKSALRNFVLPVVLPAVVEATTDEDKKTKAVTAIKDSSFSDVPWTPEMDNFVSHMAENALREIKELKELLGDNFEAFVEHVERTVYHSTESLELVLDTLKSSKQPN